MSIDIHSFYHKNTATFSYIVVDPATKKCAIIDSVVDFDPVSGVLSHESVDAMISLIKTHTWQVEWVLDTHIHADHLTASAYIKQQLGGKIAIGARIKEVLEHWVPVFNSENDNCLQAGQFDVLLGNGDTFEIGSVAVKVIHTPGHTPACLTYLMEDAAFVGDLMFMPAVGTGRADFPGGDANAQYDSITKILSLPDQTRIFVGHDYPSEGENPMCETSVIDQKQNNVLYQNTMTQEQYVQARNMKDSGKALPLLLYPSIQFNLRAGRLGYPESNGVTYIKIPVQSS